MLDVLDTVDPAAPSLPAPLPLSFRLDAAHEAHEPPEARGRARDDVRLLVSRGDRRPLHARSPSCPTSSRRRPPRGQHVGDRGRRPRRRDRRGGRGRAARVERAARRPVDGRAAPPHRQRVDRADAARRRLPVTARRPDGAAIVHLLRPAPESTRLWLAVTADGVDLAETMAADGRPIRYSYVPRDWPLDAYQTVFATEPGSAEMPSAARPFTAEIVTRLVSRGVVVAPIVLHTGVSSLEGRRASLPRALPRAAPPPPTLVNATHRAGRPRHRRRHHRGAGARDRHRSPTAPRTPATGWTDVVITPERGVRAVDGLLTGWHEPEATHLAMLEAVAGREALVAAYEAAFVAGLPVARVRRQPPAASLR